MNYLLCHTLVRLCVTGVVSEYAHRQGKSILLLQLEADCKPDGWTRMLCDNNSCFDFGDTGNQEHFDRECEKLHAELGALSKLAGSHESY